MISNNNDCSQFVHLKNKLFTLINYVLCTDDEDFCLPGLRSINALGNNLVEYYHDSTIKVKTETNLSLIFSGNVHQGISKIFTGKNYVAFCGNGFISLLMCNSMESISLVTISPLSVHYNYNEVGMLNEQVLYIITSDCKPEIVLYDFRDLSLSKTISASLFTTISQGMIFKYDRGFVTMYGEDVMNNLFIGNRPSVVSFQVTSDVRHHYLLLNKNLLKITSLSLVKTLANISFLNSDLESATIEQIYYNISKNSLIFTAKGRGVSVKDFELNN
jgi:hypothetical protein